MPDADAIARAAAAAQDGPIAGEATQTSPLGGGSAETGPIGGGAAEIGPLVGAVYQTAPPAERRRLIEHLMRPLGLLSMAAVAGGVFTAIRLRSGWDSMQVRLDDTLTIGATEVSALADMVQQVDADALDGVARLLLSSPALAGTTAAVLLLRALQSRRAGRHGPARG